MSEEETKKRAIELGGTFPQPKKAKVEPDVLVVVGGKEFREDSHHLRSISEFFDGAIRSGMKESQDMKFEFPDDNPDEWELVMSLSRPFAKAKVDEDNLDVVLPWFDKLGITGGLEACDQVMAIILNGDEFDWIDHKIYYIRRLRGAKAQIKKGWKSIDPLLKYTTNCLESNLATSKERCIDLIDKLLRYIPSILRESHWETLCKLLLEHPQLRSDLQEVFELNVSEKLLCERELEVLLQNELFPGTVASQVQKKEKATAVEFATRMFGAAPTIAPFVSSNAKLTILEHPDATCHFWWNI